MGKKILSPYRFARDEDGSVRIRIRFTEDEADSIEDAAFAANLPVLHWIHHTIHRASGNETDPSTPPPKCGTCGGRHLPDEPCTKEES
jgi:hypothetical protein